MTARPSPAQAPSAPVAEPVGDGIAAVAAEILLRYLDAGRRLAALVLGDIEQVLDAVDGLPVVSARDDRVDRHLLLDEALKNLVEIGIGRQRILVRLVLAQFRRGRLVDDIVRDDLARRPERHPAAGLRCASARAHRPASCRGP